MMAKRKLGQLLLAGLGVLGGLSLLQPQAAEAQSNERQRAPVARNQGVVRFDAAQRQWNNRSVFGNTPSVFTYGPAWNGSTGYGQYNHNYFYGGGSGYGQYSHSYFYGNSNVGAADFDRDGTPDASDNDIDGDGVPNSRDRHDYNPRRS